MKFRNKEISEMTDDELLSVSQTVTTMQNNNDLVRSSEQYKEKMQNRPMPEVNTAFLALQQAITDELDRRNKKS